MSMNEVVEQNQDEYINLSNILNNAGLFILDKIAIEWNEYVDKIVSYTKDSKEEIFKEIKETEDYCKEQSDSREMYQSIIKRMKKESSITFRQFCEFKVDDKVFRKHHEYLKNLELGNDVSSFEENEKEYAKYLCEKENKLNELKQCRANLNKIEKEYNNFIQETKSKYRKDLNKITNLNTKLKFQFQDGIKERLMQDKAIVYQMIKSEEMLMHFNYYCRDVIKKINPDFFQTFSSFEQEEIASVFFNLLISKYKNNGIDFIQLVYERDANDKIEKLMVGKAFYMHFLVGFRNTLRRFMTMAYLSIHKEHFSNINIDESFDNGKKEEDMGYDKINYFNGNKVQEMNTKKNKKVWTSDNILTEDAMNYWKYLKKYFMSNVDEMSKMVQVLFNNADDFYQTYDYNHFKNAMTTIINSIDDELSEKNFINSRIQHYVYMAFGGSRGGKVYFIRETRFIQNVLLFFMCKYIKNFEQDKFDGETYSQFCENLIEKVGNNFKNINLSDSNKLFVEEKMKIFEIY